MAQVEANGITLEVETFGDSSHPTVLLIIGLSCQLIHWHWDFCRKLAEQGYYVVRFDNRDVGLSTKLNSAGAPDIQELLASIMMGLKIKIPYTIEDMAEDTVGLLDALKIDRAHVCGMSMGGMIAQSLAVKYPERLISLTSIYSTSGNPALPPPKPEAMKVVYKRPPAEKHANIQHTVELYRVLTGNGLPYDEAFSAQIAEEAYDRSYYPDGVQRQVAAIISQKSRNDQLSTLTVPSLVIHGTEDPLVQIECGYDTAGAIPAAEFLQIDGMGHELPVLSNGHWAKIFQYLVAHFKKADSFNQN